jgi:hypothetical protein
MRVLHSVLIAAGLLAAGPALAHGGVSADIGVVIEAPDLHIAWRDAPRYRDDYYVEHERHVHHDDRHRHRPPYGRAWGHHRHRHDRYCDHWRGRDGYHGH